MARVFAVMAEFYYKQARSRYKFSWNQVLVTVQDLDLKALAQYRGTNLIGVGISHGSVILLTAAERIRVYLSERICLASRDCQNEDK